MHIKRNSTNEGPAGCDLYAVANLLNPRIYKMVEFYWQDSKEQAKHCKQRNVSNSFT